MSNKDYLGQNSFFSVSFSLEIRNLENRVSFVFFLYYISYKEKLEVKGQQCTSEQTYSIELAIPVLGCKYT
jgi:hypothetical protein